MPWRMPSTRYDHNGRVRCGFDNQAGEDRNQKSLKKKQMGSNVGNASKNRVTKYHTSVNKQADRSIGSKRSRAAM